MVTLRMGLYNVGEKENNTTQKYARYKSCMLSARLQVQSTENGSQRNGRTF